MRRRLLAILTALLICLVAGTNATATAHPATAISPSLFTAMPERTRCDISMEVGGPLITTDDNKTRYIDSILELADDDGQTVGWVYRASAPNGHDNAEYVQANRHMQKPVADKLGVRFAGNALTSLSKLRMNPRVVGLQVRRCSATSRSMTSR